MILLFKLNWDYKILTITEKKPNEFNSGLKTRYHTRANGHIPGSLKRRPTIHKTTLPKNDLKMIELENNDPKHEGREKEVAFELIIKKNELLDSLFVTLKFSVYSTHVMLAINSVFIELTAETLNPFS